MTKQQLHFRIAVALVACAAVLLLPSVAWANETVTLLDTGAAEQGLKGMVAPIIRLARKLGAVFLAGYGLFEGFKASRGGKGEWKNAIIALVVAGVLLAPKAIADGLGFDALTNSSTGAGGWGIFE